jgi:hypothetical protein
MYILSLTDKAKKDAYLTLYELQVTIRALGRTITGKQKNRPCAFGGFHYLVGHQPIPEESPYPYGTIL